MDSIVVLFKVFFGKYLSLFIFGALHPLCTLANLAALVIVVYNAIQQRRGRPLYLCDKPLTRKDELWAFSMLGGIISFQLLGNLHIYGYPNVVGRCIDSIMSWCALS
jgi:hypothetical protein